MLVFLNGKFIPEEQATVSVFDRSFCLGDGLFEAIPVYNGKTFLWKQHFHRLQAGADFLTIKMPFSSEAMASFAEQLLQENQARENILRIQLSRGVGLRGYSTKGANSPTLVMSLHPSKRYSSPAKIITSSVRILTNDPLASFKSCSKISHVIARMEADEQGADDAVLLNSDGYVAETTSANLFWIEQGTVCTPPVQSGALPGVTRAMVQALCQKHGLPISEKNIGQQLLLQTDGVFITSVAVEVREVSSLDGRDLARSPLTRILQEAFSDYVKSAHQNGGIAFSGSQFASGNKPLWARLK
ncbi:MAG: aminotransferase class IV [Verrucomicrobiota bacterium]